MITKVLQDIFRINLGVKKEERVLVFNDTPSPAESVAYDDLCRRTRLRDIALLTAEVGKAFSRRILYYEFPATGSHGAEPPAGLWERAFGENTVAALRTARLLSPLLKKEVSDAGLRKAEEIIVRHKRYAVDAVIALSNYSTSHTRFRDLLTRICGCRYASMPLFDSSMLNGSMNTEWKALAKRTNALAREVNRAESIEVNTPNGTQITLSKRGRKALADTGILTKKGAFGNLPAGEVFLAPLEGSAEGKLVLEWAPTRELRSPLTLTVRDGKVQDIAGDEPFGDFLRAKLGEKGENGNIAELGIGTNDRARRPDNIPETEKIWGTVHIALGDNSSFGGVVKTPFHQDFIFFRPTVVLTLRDGAKRELIREGTVLFPPDLK